MDRSFRALVKRVAVAIADHDLICDGDRIAIGLSGGKDSLVLLRVLLHLKRVAPIDFDIAALTVDPGWGTDYGPLLQFTRSLGVRHEIITTQIGQVVFHVRKEKNPCSLCANMRRGALHSTASAMGYNKVALAHHLDDAVETLLMNTFFSAQLATFPIRAYLTKKQVTVVRPLAYCTESSIREVADSLGLPVLRADCPIAGRTVRAEMKTIIENLRSAHDKVDESLLAAMRSYWRKSRGDYLRAQWEAVGESEP